MSQSRRMRKVCARICTGSYQWRSRLTEPPGAAVWSHRRRFHPSGQPLCTPPTDNAYCAADENPASFTLGFSTQNDVAHQQDRWVIQAKQADVARGRSTCVSAPRSGLASPSVCAFPVETLAPSRPTPSRCRKHPSTARVDSADAARRAAP